MTANGTNTMASESVPSPWSDLSWVSSFLSLLMFVFTCLLFSVGRFEVLLAVVADLRLGCASGVYFPVESAYGSHDGER